MPSLFRFLMVVSVLAGAMAGGLYVLSNIEPEAKEVTQPLSGVKVRRQ